MLYAVQPSHGTPSDLPVPDSENDLHAIAWQAAGTKLRYHFGNWTQENEQRNAILDYAPDADVIIIVDSDEIYQPMLINNISQMTHLSRLSTSVRYVRLPFIHYYRNFRRCVLHDPAYPIRVIFPKNQSGEHTWNQSAGVVNHMGYCQRAEVIRYKLHIHGHSGQFRCSPDEYVDNIYLDHNRWGDLHPIGSEYWNAETVNPLDFLPAWMAEHPNFAKEWVE